MDKVRVRIAVAVGPNGTWNAIGYSNEDAEYSMEMAVELVPDGEARYWVEADLPLPTIEVVQDEVAQTEESEQ